MPLQDPDRAVRIAADLVNADALSEPADLRRFLAEHGEPEPVAVTEDEVVATRALGGRLGAVFGAGSPAAAAGIVNELLAGYAQRPYLSNHDGTPWHLHVSRPDANWAEDLAAITAVGLAVFAAGHGFEALRRCAAAGCDAAFADTSRNHTRRFCARACATRSRVAAHRARHRQDGRPPSGG